LPMGDREAWSVAANDAVQAICFAIALLLMWLGCGLGGGVGLALGFAIGQILLWVTLVIGTPMHLGGRL
jgi:hypothetical protein